MKYLVYKIIQNSTPFNDMKEKVYLFYLCFKYNELFHKCIKWNLIIVKWIYVYQNI